MPFLVEYCLPGLLIEKLSEGFTQTCQKYVREKQSGRYLCVTRTVNWQLKDI